MADPVDLCTLDDVRTLLETRSTTLDTLIAPAITSASIEIMKLVEREFTPKGVVDATREFELDAGDGDGNAGSGHLDLNPYDLRIVTSVVLDPGGANRTLTQEVDYRLYPIPAVDGVWNRIGLSRFLASSLATTSAIRFGAPKVAVTGKWGFPAIPPDVRDACARTVRSWLRSDRAEHTFTDGEPREVSPEQFRGWTVPPEALMKTARYRRWA